MHTVVIAKPYQFVPPVQGDFWPTVFRPFLRPYVGRVWGVSQFEFEGVEVLRAAVKERSSVLLAPNHCRPCDPIVVSVLAGEAPTPLHLMASWHLFMNSRLESWFLRRVGAFSVYREGLDRTAVKASIDMLAEGRRPLVVFPEGIVTRANARLAALNEGPAFIVRSVAKQRAKSEPQARALLVPVALRYRFLGNLEESVSPVLDRIETRLTWAPRRDQSILTRLERIGSAILGLKELELVGEVRQGTIHERLGRLIDDILVPLETEWAVKKKESDVPARVRSLRGAILPDLVEGELTDEERDRRWRQLALLYLAQQLSLYPTGYLAGSPSPDRILETVERLEEDLTDVATVHRPLAVTVKVGEPIEVRPGDASPAVLMKEVRTRLQAMLGIHDGDAGDPASNPPETSAP